MSGVPSMNVPSLVDPVPTATMVHFVVVMIVIEITARHCKKRRQHLRQQNQEQHHGRRYSLRLCQLLIQLCLQLQETLIRRQQPDHRKLQQLLFQQNRHQDPLNYLDLHQKYQRKNVR